MRERCGTFRPEHPRNAHVTAQAAEREAMLVRADGASSEELCPLTVRAVTFDLWNTLLWEGPEGLRPWRLEDLGAVLSASGHPVADVTLRRAHDAVHAAYHAAWLADQRYTSQDAGHDLAAMLAPAAGPDLARDLAMAFETAGHRTPIQVVPGAEEVLGRLTAHGVLCAVVCDVGLTPVPVLERRLVSGGIAPFLTTSSWSDEVGHFKPHPAPFRHALEVLGVEPAAALHVGDRTRTDVGGAGALGMRTVRFRGVYDDPEEGPAPEAVIDGLVDLLSLPGVLG